jgi:hypothetical protein
VPVGKGASRRLFWRERVWVPLWRLPPIRWQARPRATPVGMPLRLIPCHPAVLAPPPPVRLRQAALPYLASARRSRERPGQLVARSTRSAQYSVRPVAPMAFDPPLPSSERSRRSAGAFAVLAAGPLRRLRVRCLAGARGDPVPRQSREAVASRGNHSSSIAPLLRWRRAWRQRHDIWLCIGGR